MSYIHDKYIFSGIYSEKYIHYYKQLAIKLKKFVPEQNIQYYQIDQSIFDNHKNFGNSRCVWCDQKICRFVFHQGETIKIEKQLEIYKKYLDTKKVIIFTDCDILITDDIMNKLQNIHSHTNFSKFDIFYATEKNKRRWKAGINIGLNLGYSTIKIVKLYEQILNTMKITKYPNNWDQMVVNDIFANKKTDVNYSCLPHNTLFHHKFTKGKG